MGKERLCIVLPTYNESGNIEQILAKIFEEKSKLAAWELHVAVVDGLSIDATMDMVKALQTTYPNLHLLECPRRGLGEAYKFGFQYAIETLQAAVIFEMDADGQHDPMLIPLFASLMDYNFDVVIGSRFVAGGVLENFSLYRRFLSGFGNWLVRVVGGVKGIQDCTSGYRCIRSSFIEKCDLSNLSTDGYSFQSSLICELMANKARVVEIPIVFSERQFGESKLRFRDQVEFLLNVPRLRFRNFVTFISFCMVGLSGVFVNLGMYYFLTRHLEVPMTLANVFAIELSIISNFTLNDIWTFKGFRARPLWQRFLAFHGVSALSGVLNYGVFLLLVFGFGFWDILAAFIGIVVASLVNYRGNTKLTWQRKDGD